MMLGYSRIDLSKGKIMSIRLSNSLIILITIISISACSNNNIIKKKAVIKHRVEVGSPAERKEKQLYESLLEQWDKEALATAPKAVIKSRAVTKAKIQAPRKVVQAKAVS